MKLRNIFFFSYILQLIIISHCFISIKSDEVDPVLEINEDIPNNKDYKKVEFSSTFNILNHFFKYSVCTIPSSRINAFRVEFDQFNPRAKEMNAVFCTFVDSSTSDINLIEELRMLNMTTTSCIGGFNDDGVFDGIIKYHETKKKLGIYLVTHQMMNFTARIYVRANENNLEVKEQIKRDDETYSIVPFTITISKFREYASKILFYSYTREMQMYYKEENTPYPERLFFGNILSVYTNPNMVRQKYKNADTMVLLSKNFGEPDMIGEDYLF